MRKCFALAVFAVVAYSCSDTPELPEDREALVRLADHQDFAVAVPAAQKIANKYGEDGVYQLIEKGGSNARGWACALLVGYPSERARKTLTTLLRDPSPHVRLQAMTALSTVCGKDCLPQISSLESDPDADVRRVQNQIVQRLRDQSR